MHRKRRLTIIATLASLGLAALVHGQAPSDAASWSLTLLTQTDSRAELRPCT